MIVARDLYAPRWDDSVADDVVRYWAGRGFYDLGVGSGPSVTGRRGSELGAWIPISWDRGEGRFFAIDWRKGAVTLSLRPDGDSRIRVELDVLVPPRSRLYTEWAVAFYRLEILGLGHLLSGTAPLDDAWARFNRDCRRATTAMMWTKGLIKRGLPEDWDIEIDLLEVNLERARLGST